MNISINIPLNPRVWVRRAYSTFKFLGERQRCPRRGPPGPFVGDDGTETVDYWESNSWGWGPWRRLVYWWCNGPVGNLASRIRQWGWDKSDQRRRAGKSWRLVRWIAEVCNWSSGGTKWEWPWQPRTCSYCGGAHPEDLIRLLIEGWESHGTDKGYKWYMEPPGYFKAFALRMRAYRKDAGKTPPNAMPRVWGAVPPVKLYTMHFDTVQLQRANDELTLMHARTRTDRMMA